jgi:hypothetical protein
MGLSFFLPVRKISASGTKLFLDPPSVVDGTYIAGSNVTVTFAVTDVADLVAYEVKIHYNNTVLNVINATRPIGSILEPRISPNNWFTPKWELKNDFNATHGRIWLSLTLLSPETARSGSGPLARITFQVLSTGETAITLEETKLVDKSANAITHEIQNSYFNNDAPPAPPPPIHDVAVLDVMPASSHTYIGDILEVTVAVLNKGNANESLNVILYCNNSFVAIEQTKDLRAGAEYALIFHWNTSNIAEGNYTLKALAVLIPYEANTEDNTNSSNGIQMVPKPASVGFSTNWLDWLLVILLALSIALLILWFPFKRDTKKRGSSNPDSAAQPNKDSPSSPADPSKNMQAQTFLVFKVAVQCSKKVQL